MVEQAFDPAVRSGRDPPGRGARRGRVRGTLATGLRAIDRVQQRQRGALMPWSAVAMGLGVASYFALPAEPGPAGYATLAGLVLVALALIRRNRESLGPLGYGLLLVAAGFALSGARTHTVAGPVLDFRYYGAIEGRVVALDRSASDAVRVTLDRLRLEDLPPERTPRRVRVALHGDGAWGGPPPPGAQVMLTGHLAAPSGPAEPGGFDFQRHAWFQSLGAVGYTRTPVVLLMPAEPGEARLFRLRMQLSGLIRAAIPGQPGAFAAAVLTGDRSGLDQASTQAMRDSNIAHLLAISGLHMGLLTGFVYAALRMLLALIPALALRYPIRKWAAVAALGAGAFYLALSGGSVATERAFIQVAVMFCAVLLDRRAITLRSVAIAAMILLAHRPETLMSPGFQMSFAATAALVGVFRALSDAQTMRNWPKWTRGLAALVISSAVAGAATAPFAAAHFNQLAVYGLLANLLTVPVMGSVIIPLGVLAFLLLPFGLAGPVFAVMSWGLQWILAVAGHVAALPGAVSPIASPPAGLIGLLTLGALFVLLWQGRWRWLGVLPVALAFAFWSSGTRPLVLIADSGGQVGVLTAEGRAVSRARGDGFVTSVWLENDGDRADQATAAARPGWRADGAGAATEVLGVAIWHGAGRRGLAEAEAACARHDLLVLSEPAPEALRPARDATAAALRAVSGTVPGTVSGGASGGAWGGGQGPLRLADLLPEAGRPGACRVLDGPTLRQSGALAIAPDGRITRARAVQGARPWVRGGRR
jgi:competence protein ComEC